MYLYVCKQGSEVSVKLMSWLLWLCYVAENWLNEMSQYYIWFVKMIAAQSCTILDLSKIYWVSQT